MTVLVLLVQVRNISILIKKKDVFILFRICNGIPSVPHEGFYQVAGWLCGFDLKAHIQRYKQKKRRQKNTRQTFIWHRSGPHLAENPNPQNVETPEEEARLKMAEDFYVLP